MLSSTNDSTGATIIVKQLVGQEERNDLKKDSFPHQGKSDSVRKKHCKEEEYSKIYPNFILPLN